MTSDSHATGALMTSHVNKHRRYQLSKRGYAWLSLITCCLITVALQIISMSTKEHLIGEAGAVLVVNGDTLRGLIRRTYSIFHACTAPPLSESAIVRGPVLSTCVNPTSACKETSDRIRVVQALSILALFFTALALVLMLVMVVSKALRSKRPLLLSNFVMLVLAFVCRMTLWSLIVDFVTNVSLCNNAYPLIPGVPQPRYGPSFIVEVISWIFLLFVVVLQLLVLALESGILSDASAATTSSSSTSSEDEKSTDQRTHPTYEGAIDHATEAF